MDITERIAPKVLKGKTALVTGAGQGNGRAIARGLAQAGARVIVTDVVEPNAAAVSICIRTEGGDAVAYRLDVTSAQACSELAERVRQEVGSIDILVNNAGIILRVGLDGEGAADSLARTLEVNVMGTFHPMRAWVAALRETRGAIVNVASISASVGLAHAVGYSASKAAVKLLTQSLAVELAGDGIRVNAIAPGLIDTPMTAYTRESPGRLDRFMSRTPMRRMGHAEELIGPVVFLASEMGSYVTGVTLPVDGGYLAA